jgi:hypothetical protein
MRDLLQDLDAERSLTRDDRQVVERVHEGEPLLPLQPAGLSVGLVVVGAVEHDPGAVAAGVGHLHDRGGLGHEDRRLHLEPARVIGDGLGVVAGAGGDEATLALGGGEGEELVERPPLLVGAGHLQVVELQERLRPGEARQGLGARAGGEVDLVADASARLLDVLQGDHEGVE